MASTAAGDEGLAGASFAYSRVGHLVRQNMRTTHCTHHPPTPALSQNPASTASISDRAPSMQPWSTGPRWDDNGAANMNMIGPRETNDTRLPANLRSTSYLKKPGTQIEQCDAASAGTHAVYATENRRCVRLGIVEPGQDRLGRYVRHGTLLQSAQFPRPKDGWVRGGGHQLNAHQKRATEEPRTSRPSCFHLGKMLALQPEKTKCELTAGRL